MVRVRVRLIVRVRLGLDIFWGFVPPVGSAVSDATDNKYGVSFSTRCMG